MLVQRRFRTCEIDANQPVFLRPWFVHYSIMWGFIGLAVATAIDFLFKTPGELVPLWYPSRLLGTVAGLFLMYGITVTIARWLRPADRTRSRPLPADWLFVGLLFLMVRPASCWRPWCTRPVSVPLGTVSSWCTSLSPWNCWCSCPSPSSLTPSTGLWRTGSTSSGPPGKWNPWWSSAAQIERVVRSGEEFFPAPLLRGRRSPIARERYTVRRERRIAASPRGRVVDKG